MFVPVIDNLQNASLQSIMFIMKHPSIFSQMIEPQKLKNGQKQIIEIERVNSNHQLIEEVDVGQVNTLCRPFAAV